MLPPFEEYLPFDAENKWVITASVEILDGTPVLLQKGLEQLIQVKQELAKIIDFVVIPRRQLDTRVSSYMQSVRP
jgi:Med18 protein